MAKNSAVAESRVLHIGGVRVEVVRKAMKTLRIGVYPPLGRVRVAVPLHVGDEAVRRAVAEKLPWIQKHQTRLQARQRQAQAEETLEPGCYCYFQGRRHGLQVIEAHAPPKARLGEDLVVQLQVRPGASTATRKAVLRQWQRRELQALIPELLAKWEALIGVRVAEWGIRAMKSRWGSCNTTARRVWLSLELARQPRHCLEYVLVHELVHLLERRHNARFRSFMDRFLPQWRLYRDELNQALPDDRPGIGWELPSPGRDGRGSGAGCL